MVKIGFFDSGHGGLGVLKASLSIMPSANFYYIGDSAFHPYGEKSDNDVLKRSRVLTELLISNGCELIVIACNSATAVAIDDLRIEYPMITFVGIEPYLNILTKQDFLKEERIGVLVTERTYHSKRLKKLKERVDHENRLEIEFVKDLASFVETLITQRKPIEVDKLKEMLLPVLGKKWDYVILGCTHYPLIISVLETLFEAKCLDPAPYVAKQIKELLSAHKIDVSQMTTCDNPNILSFNYMQTRDNEWSQKSIADFLWWNS